VNRLDRLDLLEKPRLVPVSDTAENFRLTQVRLEQTSAQHRAVIVKGAEARQYWKKVNETVTGTRKVREYDRIVQRAVNVARLHNDGLLEMRIQLYEEAADYRSIGAKS
jgi:hypothetical protein